MNKLPIRAGIMTQGRREEGSRYESADPASRIRETGFVLFLGLIELSMLRFLHTFLEIALWRKGPQDLPASGALAAAVLVMYVGVGLVVVQMLDMSARVAVIFIGVDVLMLSAWLWVVLAFFGRSQRFIQTITATLGVGILIGLLDILMRIFASSFGLGAGVGTNWLLIRFIIIALVMGRIFMHALDRGLLTGMALTVAIVYSTDAVAQFVLDSLGRSG